MSSARRPERLVAMGGLVLAAALAAWSITSVQPPPPVSDPGPAEFSAARARAHVAVLAAEPRPVGSAAHQRAREYLLQELASLGVEASVQRATATAPARDSGRRIGVVHNVLARVEGSGSTGVVLLIAHYDSRWRTYGAGDDASGVAALLETLRVLSERQRPPVNDVVALFADGEELGLMGARAFAEQHPWASEVAVVLNFESRGSRGPVTMFETGPGNLELVRLLSRAAPGVYANSLSYEVYRRMPNDTDFSVFRRLGLPGLNFAFIDGHPAYHSMLDTAERLSSASLAQLGSAAVAMASAAADLELPPATEEDGVYFSLPWGGLAIYPASVSLPLAGVSAALVLLTLAWGLKSGVLRFASVLKGLWIAGLTLVGSMLLGYLLWQAIERFLPHLLTTPHGLPYASGLLTLALVAGLGAWSGWVACWQCSQVRPLELAAGSLLAWGLLAPSLSALVAGAGYLFAWPAIAGSVGLAAALAWRREEAPDRRGVAALALTALPAVVLLAPIVALVSVALSLRLGAGVACFAALPLLPLLVLWRLAQPGRRAWGAIGLAAVAAGLVIGVGVTASFGPEAPAVDSLFYVLEAGEERAAWMSWDEAPDGWTGKRLGESPERGAEPPFGDFGDRSLLSAPAPVLPLAVPELVVVSEQRSGPQADRKLRVRVRSPRGAPNLRLEAESSVPIMLSAVEGRPPDGPEVEPEFEDRVVLSLFGVPPEGVVLTFDVPGRWPIEARLVDQSYGLPEVEPALGERPPGLMSSVSWLSDSTFVATTVFF